MATNLVGQNWYEQIEYQNKLIKEITDGEKWEDILEYGLSEIKLPESYLSDISQSIKFSNDQRNKSTIDNFFHNLCDSIYTEFPYRKSGHLTKNLYIVPKKDTSHVSQILAKSFGKSLYSEFAQIVNIPEEELIPKLLYYLNNDSATRLCIRPIDWDESPFYLSISDVAMELIEVKTYCDFFDNASHSQMLFSNLSDKEKDEIITGIEKWMRFSNGESQIRGIEYFLDSICDLGNSYVYTCNNLLYFGDTLVAKTKYRHYYEENKLPCRKSHNVGKKLSLLGDNILMEDCLHDIYDYRCMADNGMKCVPFIFKNAKSHIPFDVLADIVSTERFSRYKRTRSKFIWHAIFNEIATTENPWTKSIIVELLSIDDELKASKINARNWERLYKEQFEEGYRVCDFALVKYFETIKKEVKLTYGNLDEKKLMNQILDEIDSLDIDRVEDRNKMIEIIKKYED